MYSESPLDVCVCVCVLCGGGIVCILFSLCRQKFIPKRRRTSYPPTQFPFLGESPCCFWWSAMFRTRLPIPQCERYDLILQDFPFHFQPLAHSLLSPIPAFSSHSHNHTDNTTTSIHSHHLNHTICMRIEDETGGGIPFLACVVLDFRIFN